jgi:hypothetical protein
MCKTGVVRNSYAFSLIGILNNPSIRSGARSAAECFRQRHSAALRYVADYQRQSDFCH